MVDFKKALHKSNIQKLINEKGVFIAHTYFAAPMKYHTGRLFENANQINQEVAENFAYLGKKISENEIWNPTLNELINYMSQFESVVLDVDDNGNIFVLNSNNLIYRKVS